MQFLMQRRTLETNGHDWAVNRKRKSELAIIILGSIIGFAVLMAIMLYAGYNTPNH